jgi:hypothetical protein
MRTKCRASTRGSALPLPDRGLSQTAARHLQTRVKAYAGELGSATRCELGQLAVRLRQPLDGFSRAMDPPGLLGQTEIIISASHAMHVKPGYHHSGGVCALAKVTEADPGRGPVFGEFITHRQS